MWHVELYDRRYDWLIAALLAIPLVWLSYGFDAAFISLLIFTLVGALKPLTSRLGSRLAAGVFAAGAVLLLSPLLRYVFYSGYCFEGVWSPGAGLSRYIAPSLCAQRLFSDFAQGIWIGPLRDLAMPVAGLGLMVLAWLDPKQAAQDAEQAATEGEDEARPMPWHRRLRLTNWGLLAIAFLLWAAVSHQNYQAEQERLEQQRREELAQLARDEAAAAEEARRIAAEKAAKRVERKWMLGGWVSLDGLSETKKSDPKTYCATDLALIFSSNGSYSWYDESGLFALKDNEVEMSARKKYEMGGDDGPPELLDSTTIKVERNGSRLMIDGGTYGRC